MRILVPDLRDSWRALRQTPAFTLGAVLTIALAAGATTAIFSVVYGVLLRQLPYRDAARVVWMWSDRAGRDPGPFNVPDFLDYRQQSQLLTGIAGFFGQSTNLSDERAAERIQGLRATGNLFAVLGADALVGRVLRPADEEPGSDHVAVLTEPFWRRRFGADPDVIGRPIRLNGEDHLVIGIAAAGFAVPVGEVDVVVPFAAPRDPRRGARNSVNFILAAGRLGDGVSVAQAAAELDAIAQRLQAQFPVENARKRGVRLAGAIDGIAGWVRTALWTLLAAVGAVLLIACANLANLMLARADGRRREVAVRMALGSSRGRIVRLVLIEALLVSAAGGVLGWLLARWSVTGLITLAPTVLPRAGDIRVDTAVLVFSLALSSLTALLFGVIPALTSARVDVREAIDEGGRSTTAGRRGLRSALVGAEVALAVLLLVVMAMLGKSFRNVLAVAPGFDATGVLSTRVALPAQRFTTREAIEAFQQMLAPTLLGVPGVTHAGAISSLPLSGVLLRVPFTVDGRAIERERVPVAQYRMVTAGYFDAARIPLRRGRAFTDRDRHTTRAVGVVNEALAREWLGGLDPIGARLLVDDNNSGPRPIEIVGVVGDVRQLTLEGAPTWDLYLPYSQLHPDNAGLAAANLFWIVRTTGDPRRLTAGLAKAVRSVDADVAASRIVPMDQYIADALAPRRFSLWLMAAFAIAALALAITGIYAVVTCSVRQRAREWSIRLALGATRARIVRLVITRGAVAVMAGLLIGLVMATEIMHVLSSMLFGVAAVDVATLALVAGVVTAVSLVACAVPAMATISVPSGATSAARSRSSWNRRCTSDGRSRLYSSYARWRRRRRRRE